MAKSRARRFRRDIGSRCIAFDAYRAAHADSKLKPSGYIYPVGFNIGFAGLERDAALIGEADAALAAMLESGRDRQARAIGRHDLFCRRARPTFSNMF